MKTNECFGYTRAFREMIYFPAASNSFIARLEFELERFQICDH